MEVTRRVKRSRRVRAAGRAAQSRMFAGRWRAGRAREQISPLSETTSWNSRYSRPKIGARIARAKRPESEGTRGGGRAEQRERKKRSVVALVKGDQPSEKRKNSTNDKEEKEEEEEEEDEEKKIKCRTRHFEFPARIRPESGRSQHIGERTDRADLLNPGISESFEQCWTGVNIYTRPLPSHLFCHACRLPKAPSTSTWPLDRLAFPPLGSHAVSSWLPGPN